MTKSSSPSRLDAFFGNPAAAVGMAVVCNVLWGSAFPFIKMGYRLFAIDATDTASIMCFAGVRFMHSALLVYAGGAALRRGPLPMPKGKNLLSCCGLGLWQTAAQYTFYYSAVALLTGAMGGILNSTQSFMGVILAHFLYGKAARMTPRKAIGCALGFSGVLVATLGNHGSGSPAGVAYMLIASVIFALAGPWNKAVTQKVDSVTVSCLNLGVGGAALLVIGQFLDALNSGKYDLDHTALLITQTGGGCRASNYIHLLRKALVKAGYPQIPVASLNFSGLEKDSGFQMTLPLARRALACIFYGDMLCALRNQVAPYENEKGAADKMVDLWVQRLGRVLLAGKGFTSREMTHTFPLIAKDFKSIPVTRVPKVKVGVVGEIYVKYSPLGNNDLQKFLESQDCEVNFPGLMGFVQYCIFNMGEDHVLYGGKLAMKMGTDQLLNWLDSVERSMLTAAAAAGFYAPGPFKELVEKPAGIISLGAKMGEGWLLTAEMIELVQGGYGNIVCAQPFGCLPNHIVGKGMESKIRKINPDSKIVAVDYDPGATKVNQENRIKLMLASAAAEK